MPRFFKSEKTFLIFLSVFNLILRVARLNSPSEPFLNEKYFILPAVRDILLGHGDTMPFTPPSPLAKILFAFSLKMFGDSPFGWRILPALFTVASVVLTYFLAKEIFKSRTIATSASLLLTFESAIFVHSRSVDPEAIVVTFILLSLLFAWKILSSHQIRWAAISGLSFGLALTIKPQAFFAIIAVILAILVSSRAKFQNRIYPSLLILLISSFIYLVIYLPVFQKSGILGFISLHQRIKQYHTQYWPQNYYQIMSKTEYGPRLPQIDQYMRYPITWLKNPKILYFEKDTDSKKQLVLFTFNPMIFFPAIGAFLLGLVLAVKKRDQRIIFLLLISSSAYFPYLASSLYRALTYPPYYLLSSLPSLIILLSYFLTSIWQRQRGIFILYMLLVIAAFVIYYPLLAAVAVDHDYFHLLTGLR